MVLFLSVNNKSSTRSRATSQMCEKYYTLSSSMVIHKPPNLNVRWCIDKIAIAVQMGGQDGYSMATDNLGPPRDRRWYSYSSNSIRWRRLNAPVSSSRIDSSLMTLREFSNSARLILSFRHRELMWPPMMEKATRIRDKTSHWRYSTFRLTLSARKWLNSAMSIP